MDGIFQELKATVVPTEDLPTVEETAVHQQQEQEQQPPQTQQRQGPPPATDIVEIIANRLFISSAPAQQVSPQPASYHDVGRVDESLPQAPSAPSKNEEKKEAPTASSEDVPSSEDDNNHCSHPIVDNDQASSASVPSSIEEEHATENPQDGAGYTETDVDDGASHADPCVAREASPSTEVQPVEDENDDDNKASIIPCETTLDSVVEQGVATQEEVQVGRSHSELGGTDDAGEALSELKFVSEPTNPSIELPEIDAKPVVEESVGEHVEAAGTTDNNDDPIFPIDTAEAASQVSVADTDILAENNIVDSSTLTGDIVPVTNSNNDEDNTPIHEDSSAADPDENDAVDESSASGTSGSPTATHQHPPSAEDRGTGSSETTSDKEPSTSIKHDDVTPNLDESSASGTSGSPATHQHPPSAEDEGKASPESVPDTEPTTPIKHDDVTPDLDENDSVDESSASGTSGSPTATHQHPPSAEDRGKASPESLPDTEPSISIKNDDITPDLDENGAVDESSASGTSGSPTATHQHPPSAEDEGKASPESLPDTEPSISIKNDDITPDLDENGAVDESSASGTSGSPTATHQHPPSAEDEGKASSEPPSDTEPSISKRDLTDDDAKSDAGECEDDADSTDSEANPIPLDAAEAAPQLFEETNIPAESNVDMTTLAENSSPTMNNKSVDDDTTGVHSAADTNENDVGDETEPSNDHLTTAHQHPSNDDRAEVSSEPPSKSASTGLAHEIPRSGAKAVEDDADLPDNRHRPTGDEGNGSWEPPSASATTGQAQETPGGDVIPLENEGETTVDAAQASSEAASLTADVPAGNEDESDLHDDQHPQGDDGCETPSETPSISTSTGPSQEALHDYIKPPEEEAGVILSKPLSESELSVATKEILGDVEMSNESPDNKKFHISLGNTDSVTQPVEESNKVAENAFTSHADDNDDGTAVVEPFSESNENTVDTLLSPGNDPTTTHHNPPRDDDGVALFEISTSSEPSSLLIELAEGDAKPLVKEAAETVDDYDDSPETENDSIPLEITDAATKLLEELNRLTTNEVDSTKMLDVSALATNKNRNDDDDDVTIDESLNIGDETGPSSNYTMTTPQHPPASALHNSPAAMVEFLEKQGIRKDEGTTKNHVLAFSLTNDPPDDRTLVSFQRQIVQMKWWSPCMERSEIPSISWICKICYAIHAYLKIDPSNVALVYCSNGKTRTAIAVACYLKFAGLVSHAKHGFLQVLTKQGMENPKSVWNQLPPTLQLFFHQFDSVMDLGGFVNSKPLLLRAIALEGIPVEDKPCLDIWDSSQRHTYTSHPELMLPKDHEGKQKSPQHLHTNISQWTAGEQGFYRVNIVLEGDFLLLCRFGGDFAEDPSINDSSKILFRYSNTTGFLTGGRPYELTPGRVDLSRRYATDFDDEDFLVTLLFDESWGQIDGGSESLDQLAKGVSGEIGGLGPGSSKRIYRYHEIGSVQEGLRIISEHHSVRPNSFDIESFRQFGNVQPLERYAEPLLHLALQCANFDWKYSKVYLLRVTNLLASPKISPGDGFSDQNEEVSPSVVPCFSRDKPALTPPPSAKRQRCREMPLEITSQDKNRVLAWTVQGKIGFGEETTNLVQMPHTSTHNHIVSDEKEKNDGNKISEPIAPNPSVIGIRDPSLNRQVKEQRERSFEEEKKEEAKAKGTPKLDESLTQQASQDGGILEVNSHRKSGDVKVKSQTKSEAGVPLKDDPEYSKYFKMLKMSMPREQILHAMTRDGKEHEILDLDPERSLKSQQTKSKDDVDGPPLKDDPEFSKYFKMLRMMMPKDQVAHAMTRDGKDSSILDMDPSKSLKTQVSSSKDAGDGGPPLKDDPEFSKYFKMLKCGLPIGAIKNAISRDGKDPSIMDLDHGKSLKSQQKQEADTGPPLKDDPEYAKYFKMIKCGLPLGAVKNALARDGKDPAIMDLDPNKSLRAQTAGSMEKDTGVPLKDDPEYQKYFRMLRMGLPIDAVKNALTRDGKNPAVMDLDPTKSLSFQSTKSTETKGQAKKKKSVRRKKVYWNPIDPTKLKEDSMWNIVRGAVTMGELKYDQKEFEDLFTESPDANHRNKKKEVKKEKKKLVQVIDPKRSMNGGIVLARLKTGYPKIAEYVNRMDHQKFNSTQLKALKEYLPDADERRGLIAYMKKGQESSEAREKLFADCSETEKYMVTMIDVQDASGKLDAMLFRSVFKTRFEDATEGIRTLNSACEQLRTSEKLRKLMAVILAVVNQINTGGEGNMAMGFSLDALLKLNEAKAFDKKTSVLHYVVKLVKKNDESLLSFDSDVSSVVPAENVLLDGLSGDVKSIAEELEGILGLVQQQADDLEQAGSLKPMSLTDLSEQRTDVRVNGGVTQFNKVNHLTGRTSMERFALNAKNACAQATESINNIKKKYCALLQYFGEDEQMATADFFGTLRRFVAEWRKAVEQVEAIEKKEAKEKRRAEARAARAKGKERGTSRKTPKQKCSNAAPSHNAREGRSSSLAALAAAAANSRKQHVADKTGKGTDQVAHGKPPPIGGIATLAAAAAAKGRNLERKAVADESASTNTDCLADGKAPPTHGKPPQIGGIATLAAAAAAKGRNLERKAVADESVSTNTDCLADGKAPPTGGIPTLAAAAAAARGRKVTTTVVNIDDNDFGHDKSKATSVQAGDKEKATAVLGDNVMIDQEKTGPLGSVSNSASGSSIERSVLDDDNKATAHDEAMSRHLLITSDESGRDSPLKPVEKIGNAIKGDDTGSDELASATSKITNPREVLQDEDNACISDRNADDILPSDTSAQMPSSSAAVETSATRIPEYVSPTTSNEVDVVLPLMDGGKHEAADNDVAGVAAKLSLSSKKDDDRESKDAQGSDENVVKSEPRASLSSEESIEMSAPAPLSNLDEAIDEGVAYFTEKMPLPSQNDDNRESKDAQGSDENVVKSEPRASLSSEESIEISAPAPLSNLDDDNRESKDAQGSDKKIINSNELSEAATTSSLQPQTSTPSAAVVDRSTTMEESFANEVVTSGTRKTLESELASNDDKEIASVLGETPEAEQQAVANAWTSSQNLASSPDRRNSSTLPRSPLTDTSDDDIFHDTLDEAKLTSPEKRELLNTPILEDNGDHASSSTISAMNKDLGSGSSFGHGPTNMVDTLGGENLEAFFDAEVSDQSRGKEGLEDSSLSGTAGNFETQNGVSAFSDSWMNGDTIENLMGWADQAIKASDTESVRNFEMSLDLKSLNDFDDESTIATMQDDMSVMSWLSPSAAPHHFEASGTFDSDPPFETSPTASLGGHLPARLSVGHHSTSGKQNLSFTTNSVGPLGIDDAGLDDGLGFGGAALAFGNGSNVDDCGDGSTKQEELPKDPPRKSWFQSWIG